MKHSKKMYIISPQEWERMKNGAQRSEDIEVNKRNENMMQNKILAEHERDREWKKYGTKMGEIVAEGIDRSKLANPPPPLSSPIPPQTPSPMPTASSAYNETSFIREGVGKNNVNKISRLYYLLKAQPGIAIDPYEIRLDNNYIGPSLDVLKQLCFNNKHMRYQLEPLLDRIANNTTIVSLIGNYQAKQYLGILPPTPIRPMTLPSRGTSTPKKADKKQDESSELDDEDTTIFQSLGNLHTFGAEGGDYAEEEQEEEGQEERGTKPKTPRGRGRFSLEQPTVQPPRKGSGIKKTKKKALGGKLRWKSLF